MSQTITPAAQVIISIIPIVGIVMGATVVFFYLLWRHTQIIKQIEAGVYRTHRVSLALFCLLSGALLTGIGAVLSLVFLYTDGPGYPLLGGLIPFAIGVSLLCVYAKLNSRAADNDSSAD